MAKKRKLKMWHLAAGIPVVFCLGGWLYTEAVLRMASGDVERELERLAKLGVPTSPAAMRPTIGVTENAADLYRQAIDRFEARDKREPAVKRGPHGEPDPNDVAKYRAWVDSNAAVLDLVRQAAAKPGCDFNRDWSQGASLMFREFSDMKPFVKMMVFRARDCADARDFAGAAGWLSAGLSVARHTQEPTLIGQLVSIACEAIVLNELQREADSLGSDAAFARAMRPVVEGVGPLPSMYDGMKGEVLMVTVTFDQLDAGKTSTKELGFMGGDEYHTQTMEERLIEQAMKYPWVRRQVEAKILARYRHLYEKLADQPDLLQTIKAFNDLDTEFMSDTSFQGKIAGIFGPTFAQAAQAVARCEAGRRVTRCGLELWATRSATGVFPNTLDGTHPWEIDPFTGKPLVYRRDGERFILYSIGPNGKDEQGGRSRLFPSSDDVQFNAKAHATP